MLATNLWVNHPDWPRSEWRLEVSGDNTLLGYWEWVQAKLDQEEDDGR